MGLRFLFKETTRWQELGVKPPAFRSEVQHVNHYTYMLSLSILLNSFLQRGLAIAIFFLESSSVSVFLSVTNPRLLAFTWSKNTCCKLSVNIGKISQNFCESRCRKLSRIQWHKSPFNKSEDEDASKL